MQPDNRFINNDWSKWNAEHHSPGGTVGSGGKSTDSLKAKNIGEKFQRAESAVGHAALHGGLGAWTGSIGGAVVGGPAGGNKGAKLGAKIGGAYFGAKGAIIGGIHGYNKAVLKQRKYTKNQYDPRFISK